MTSVTLPGPDDILPNGLVGTLSEVAHDFTIGQSYLVFAFGPSLREARPNGCSTVPLAKAGAMIQHLDSLAKSYPPKSSAF